ISNNNWQNGYNGDWDKMPKFVTDTTGHINQNLTLRAKTDKPAGQYKIIVKAKEISSGNDYYSSYKNIDIFEITPTTIPSLFPSVTPTSTSTPSPFPTITPLPTDNPSPSNEPLPTDDPNSQVLGSSDLLSPSPTPTIKTKTFSPNLIPTIFIILGAGLLLIPLIFSKIKFRRR
ncbi:MAG: hypothetical protein NTY75_05265, partial [Candidatus Shapirobacteria bacterium]|nr:hypothetical protein [Candidatus Shapirobacteria bacterium]